MKISADLLHKLQQRLKTGDRRGVHLNATINRSNKKLDLKSLDHIKDDLAKSFIDCLLSKDRFSFRVSEQDAGDLMLLPEERQHNIVKTIGGLRNIKTAADSDISELGIDTFGFGFPLLIKRSNKDGKVVVAPLLIWNLHLKQEKSAGTYSIERTDDDPISINEVLINSLKSTEQIDIDPIPDEMLEDGMIDRKELDAIVSNVLGHINPKAKRGLNKPSFTNANRNIAAIKDRAAYQSLCEASSSAMIEWSGLFSIFRVQKQNLIKEYDLLRANEEIQMSLDAHDGSGFQPLSSVPTDPSQQSVIHSIQDEKGLLIQGPPGTGKSQTLTAILVNALENGLKTLVVCEKRTALDVLQSELADRNLDQHCVTILNASIDRKDVVNGVRNRVDGMNSRSRPNKPSRRKLDQILRRCDSLIDKVNRGHRKIDESLIDTNNWTTSVGHYLKNANSLNDQERSIDLSNIPFEFTSKECEDYHDLWVEGQELATTVFEFGKNNWNPTAFSTCKDSFALEATIRTAVATYEDEYNRIEQALLAYCARQKSKVSDYLDAFSAINQKINTVLVGSSEDLINDAKCSGILYRLASYFDKDKKETLSKRKELTDLCRAVSLNHHKHGYKFTAPELSSTLSDCLSELRAYAKQINEESRQLLAQIEEDINSFYVSTTSCPRSEDALEIQSLLRALSGRIVTDGYLQVNALSENGMIPLNLIQTYTEELRDNLDTPGKLRAAVDYYRWFHDLTPLNLRILALIEPTESWSTSFLVAYYNQLLTNFATDELPIHDGDHTKLYDELDNIESPQLEYIRSLWENRQYVARERYNATHSTQVKNLYNKRSSNQHSRLSLRRIVKTDTDLFTTFYPIVLTTPDTSSQLFEGMNEYFDIVLFDEASQLRLEDTLPALLKGKQKIVAGDEHQMAPSSYFINEVVEVFEENGSQGDDEGPTETQTSLDSKSLLEFAEEHKFAKQYLDFHYRSQHPDLIEFSNQAFYEGRLVSLPPKFDYRPITFVEVKGRYHQNKNYDEIETVLSIIENNIHADERGNFPTVGIATTNISQRNAIMDVVDQRRGIDKYEDFIAKFDALSMHPNGELFVKNLENIQGDERDIIIITTNFGPVNGKVNQNFGPLTRANGYKLLNVIVTRSKFKTYVCTSIPAAYYNLYPNLLAAKGNRGNGLFYAYLAYAKAVSDGDEGAKHAVLQRLRDNSDESTHLKVIQEGNTESIFEEEVYTQLLKHLNKDNLFLQQKCAGYRIDMVYQSDKKNVPPIAIECDGAKYHSSREAYLHDRARQRVLEGHGYVFHRIWSTNWWKNEDHEMKKLLRFIRDTVATVKQSQKDNKVCAQFLHDVNPATALMSVSASMPSAATPDEKSTKEGVSTVKASAQNGNLKNIKPTLQGDSKIGINDVVKIRYLTHADHELNVKIVDSDRISKPNKAYREVRVRTALGMALLGARVGDAIQLGKAGTGHQIMILSVNAATAQAS